MQKEKNIDQKCTESQNPWDKYINTCETGMSEIKEGDWIEKLFEEKNVLNCIKLLDFPDSSVDKESACNAGDPILIPG